MRSPAERLLAAALFFTSAGTVHKYGGPAGLAVYAAACAAGFVILGRLLSRPLTPRAERTAGVFTACGFILLLAAFIFIYPKTNAGVFGPGSDRDEDLTRACALTLSGLSPYGELTYSGHPVQAMPGMIAAALPVHAAGNAAFGHLFGRAALFAALRRQCRSTARASLVFWALLILSPEILREFLTGGTLLTNALFISTAVYWLVDAADSPAPTRLIAASALVGALLSSRPNFLLLLPVLSVYLFKRRGARMTVVSLGTVLAALAAITASFYLKDPAHFPSAGSFNIFERLAGTLPMTAAMPFFFAVLSALLALGTGTRRADLFFMAGIVQFLPAASLFFVWLATNGANAFSFTGYGVASLFFFVFAFGESFRDGLRRQTVA